MSADVKGSLFGICSPIEELRDLNKKINPILERLRVLFSRIVLTTLIENAVLPHLQGQRP